MGIGVAPRYTGCILPMELASRIDNLTTVRGMALRRAPSRSVDKARWEVTPYSIQWVHVVLLRVGLVGGSVFGVRGA